MVKDKNTALQKEGLTVVQEKLAALTGKKRVVLGGRVNTLWAAFLKCIEQKPYVVFPAIMCPSPIFVAQYLGFKPLLCDVREQDGLICPDSLLSLLNSYGDQIAAVLAVDLYGNRPCMERLNNICKAKGVFLVEDAAHALGVRGMGEYSDVCLVSFGRKKIIDCDFGGTLLTDSDELAEGVKNNLDTFTYSATTQIKSLGDSYRACYYSIHELVKQKPEAVALYRDFYKFFHELYFVRYDVPDWRRISEELDRLEQNLANRRYHTSVYVSELSKLQLRPLGFSDINSSAPWRFTFLVEPEIRDKLLTWLWQKNWDASFWYPSMEGWFYEPANFKLCSVANRLTPSIVNLWVNKSDRNYSYQVVKCIKAFFGGTAHKQF